MARSRGFARLELAAVVAVTGVVGSLALVAGNQARLSSGLGRSLANLQEHAEGYAAFALDHDNEFATFTWTADDVDRTPYGDLHFLIENGGTDASSAQAIHILRTHADRLDIQPFAGWVPYVLYTQLVLAEYLNEELPSRMFVSPGDTYRLGWQDGNEPLPGGGSGANKRWEFSSSYEVPAAFWNEQENDSPRIYQGGTQASFIVPHGIDFDGRRLETIRFPSQKVMVYESAQRFFGPRDAYWAYAEARVPLLLSDGSAGVRMTGDANKGWDAGNPASGMPTSMRYSPADWNPPQLGDTPSPFEQFVYGHYRWTRGSGAGRDFGPEIPVGE